MDAPAGVGYSLNLNQNFTFTDSQVAADNHAALAAFFTLFPELKSNDFFIGGESYAGYYIPMLADRLINDSSTFPNFKGYLVGNGCLNDRMLFNSGIQYNYNHAFIDERFYESSVQQCCGGRSSEGCDWYKFAATPENPCYNISLQLNEANFYAGVDPYFLYFSCYLDQPDGKTRFNRRPSLGGNSASAMRRHLMKRFGNAKAGEAADADKPACSHYDDMVYWLNRNDVRNAIHVPARIQEYKTCRFAPLFIWIPSLPLQSISNTELIKYFEKSDQQFLEFILRKSSKFKWFIPSLSNGGVQNNEMLKTRDDIHVNFETCFPFLKRASFVFYKII